MSCFDKLFKIHLEDVEKMYDEKNVKGLTKALNYKGDAMVRERAALALGSIGGAKEIDPLIHALKDDHYGVRDGAAKALVLIIGYQGVGIDKKTCRSLIEVLTDKDPNFWKGLLFALSQLSNPTYTVMKDGIVYNIKWTLTREDPITKPLIQEIIKAAKNEDYNVRSYAEIALKNLGLKS